MGDGGEKVTNGFGASGRPVSELDQILAWTIAGESDSQEFKATTADRYDACKTLTGFLNLRGGRVLFGVQPDGRVTGQMVTDRTLEKIWEHLREITPEITPTVERIPVPDSDGAEVLVVSVVQGRYRPYMFKGTPYKRVGAVTTTMEQAEYQRLFLETHHATDRWETETSPLGLNDLDLNELTATMTDAVARGRVSDPLSGAPDDILRGFGLLRDGQLLNAAVVLFGRADRLLPHYTQCVVKLVRWEGIDKGERMIEQRQEYGNAFQILRLAERFCRDHLRISATLVPGRVQRIDEPEIPILALREALANAVSHREYSTGSGSISVEIYDDRVEITSVGPLHFGLSVADLYRPHESQPWNPLVAGTLYRRGVIDNLGSGTLRMIKLTRDAGLFEPEIVDTGQSVRVDFPRAGALPARLHGLPIRRSAYDVLELIAQQGPIALRELVTGLAGRSERDVRDELQHLRSLDAIESTGHGRGARWQLRTAVS